MPASLPSPAASGDALSRLEKTLLRLLALLAFLLAWWAFTLLRPSLLMPTPAETAVALIDLLPSAELWDAMWVSNQAMILGFLASCATGIPLGLAVGRFKLLHNLANPYLNLILAIPISALLPIFIMALGIGLTARVAVVYAFSIAVIVITTAAGVRSIDANWIAMARSFGASEAQLWRSVLLPGSVPAILAALRLGLARSLSGMVVVELLLVSVGIGRLMLRYQARFDAEHLYAVVIMVLLEAIILIRITAAVHQRLTGPIHGIEPVD